MDKDVRNDKKKKDLIAKKENIVCSLNEVECFLCKASKAIRCFKFCSLFK